MKFELTAEELKKVRAFQKKQDKLWDKITGKKNSQSAYTFSFTLTGIGTVSKLVNESTRNVLDLTDYGSW